MKLILTGGTGFIGGEVLAQCLEHPEITSIVALSRRELSIKNEKLKNVIIKDFSSYPDEAIREVEDADACIWALGSYDGSLQVEVEYPGYLTRLLGDRLGNRAFRFVFLGGAFSVGDQDASLWFIPTARKGKGLGETRIMAAGSKVGGKWETYVVKPGGVEPKYTKGIISFITGRNLGIPIDVTAAAMIDIALQGSDEKIIKNFELSVRGKLILEKGAPESSVGF